MDKVNALIQEDVLEDDHDDETDDEIVDTSIDEFISERPTRDHTQNHIERINPALLSEVVGFLNVFNDCFKEIESEKLPSFHKVTLWRFYLLNEFKPKSMDSHNMKTLKI